MVRITECISAINDWVCPTSVNEMPAGKRLPCQKEACAIQKCLQGTSAPRLENSSLYMYILCDVDKSEININVALPILLLAQNKTTKKIDAGW